MTGFRVPVPQKSGQAEDDSGRYASLPAFLETRLMSFQRLGVKFALSHGGRVLIGDEMGTLSNPL